MYLKSVNRKIRSQMHAFSLIEMMVVVAIVAILSAVAVPSYKKEVITTQVASLLPVIDGLKNTVMEQHNYGIVFGATQEVQIASTDPNKPKYLNQLIRDNYGCVTAQYDLNQMSLDSSGGKNLSLVVCPINDTTNRLVNWNCGASSGSTADYIKYLPQNCQQVVSEDTTF